MTPFRLRLFAVGLACGVILLLWAMGKLPRLHATGRGRAALFLTVLVLAGTTMVAGAELQQWYRVWERVEGWRTEPPFEGFVARGDPGLLRWAQTGPGSTRPPPAPAARWLRWQSELRDTLVDEVFRIRPAAAPAMRVLRAATPAPGVVRRFVTFAGGDGTPIPGYLFEPQGRGRRPAVLVLSGHGHGIVETAGLVPSYQNSVALRLARAGYVAFTPELRGFGYLGPRAGFEHSFVAYNAFLAGSFYKAVLARDLARAVDLLQTLPSVDPARLAVTGVSYGGEMAVTYAALDTRLRVVVAQGYGGEGVGPYPGRTGGWFTLPDHYCHVIPGANRFMGMEDLFLLIAPRPLLVVRGTANRPPSDTTWRLVRASYAALGHEGAFVYHVAPGGHEYFVEPALTFLRGKL